MIEAEVKDLLHFAETWTALGRAITEQVEQVVEDPACGSCHQEGTEHGVNPRAIEIAADKLRGMNQELDEILSTFLESVRRDR